MATLNIDPDRLRFEYFRTGVDCYVTGRFGHYAHALPVVGNLFHHAIEMFLKGAMVWLDEDGRRKLGHKLGKLWAEFRSRNTDPTIGGLSATIASLDPFEELRYPEKGLTTGMTIAIGAGTVEEPTGDATLDAQNQAIPHYGLDIDQVDELVIALHTAASVNPKAMAQHLGPEGFAYLAKHNKLAASWRA